MYTIVLVVITATVWACICYFIGLFIGKHFSSAVAVIPCVVEGVSDELVHLRFASDEELSFSAKIAKGKLAEGDFCEYRLEVSRGLLSHSLVKKQSPRLPRQALMQIDSDVDQMFSKAESPTVDGAHFTPIDDGMHVEVKQ